MNEKAAALPEWWHRDSVVEYTEAEAVVEPAGGRQRGRVGSRGHRFLGGGAVVTVWEAAREFGRRNRLPMKVLEGCPNWLRRRS